MTCSRSCLMSNIWKEQMGGGEDSFLSANSKVGKESREHGVALQ